LKRLIRGNGSSTTSSRIGFNTALTGLLKSNVQQLPKVSAILEIVAKEFQSTEEKGKVDSLVGTALVCGSIIRSEKMMADVSEDEIEEMSKFLVACLSKPSVTSLAYNFLNELVIKVSLSKFHLSEDSYPILWFCFRPRRKLSSPAFGHQSKRN